MNEKSYKKRLELQQKMIARQSQQIESLSAENAKLRLQIEEKDIVINSVSSLREELKQNVEETKVYKEQYQDLIDELRKMRKIMNKEVFKGRWGIVKLLIK